MNNKTLKLREFLLGRATIVALFIAMSVAMTSCLDDDDGTVPESAPYAYVSLYHGAPGAPDLDITADNRRIFLNPMEYTEHTGYLRFYTGERTLKFLPFNASNTLADTTMTLEEFDVYSIFLTGEGSALEPMIVEDDIQEPEEGMASIRVVHLSPDSPTVSLSMDDETEGPLFEGVAYKNASEFIEIPSGRNSFEITSEESNEVLATVSDINFQEGRVYTLAIRGYSNPPAGNTNGISIQVLQSFFNY